MRLRSTPFSLFHGMALAWAFVFLAGCAHAVTEEPPIDTIVDKMTSTAVFRLVPEQAQAYFDGLCRLASRGPGKHLWVHDDPAPGNGLAWVRVEFQPGEKAPWSLLQGSIVLPPATAAHRDLYATLKARLRARLGRPELTEESAEDKMVVWAIGGERKLILRRGAIDNPYLKQSQLLVSLDAALAQGR